MSKNISYTHPNGYTGLLYGKSSLKEYSEYGMDDIANDLISIQATLEVVRLKMQYAMVKGD